MTKYDVFISYSRKDSEIVKLVANHLKEERLSVWIDEDGIESGDLFKKVITTAIENSACLLFFSSKASNSSTWTAKEIGIAIYEKIPVIPVILDNSKYNPEIKFDLVNLDFVDMRDKRLQEKSIARIVKAIKKLPHRLDYEVSEFDGISASGEVEAFHNGKNQGQAIQHDFQKSESRSKHNSYISVIYIILVIVLLVLYSYSNKTLDANEYVSQVSNEEEAIEVVGTTVNDESLEDYSKYASLDPQNHNAPSNQIKLTGMLANKEMDLYLSPSGHNGIGVLLEIDGEKFSTSYNAFLNRKTLRADLENDDGTYIGHIEGIITIKDNIITYKGSADSMEKTYLFETGDFEFHGDANAAIVKMMESQSNADQNWIND